MKNCPTCGSKIDKAKKDSISTKIAEMESALNVAREDFRASKESWDYFKNNETQRFHNEIELLRSSISKSQEEIQKELNTYHSIDSSVSEKNVIIESHNNKMNYIKSMGDVKNREINNIEESLKKLESIKLRIAKSSVEIDEKSSSIYSITGDIGICDWFINNVPYIKLHKLSTSMEELTNVVNGYLSDMGDTIRVNISSFDEKAKKKNAADVKDLLKSEVKVEINDGDKKIDPRLYSDGEISKVSNAFIRGLNELARKFGYGCNLMLLDEVFSFIDMDNSHKLVDSFKKDFRKRGTVLITDNSGISENLLTFDGTWIARKSNGKTVLSIHKGLSETKE
jgi:ABC-type dipeptide/oligopeptide/nickel transport system ATPase subunit